MDQIAPGLFVGSIEAAADADRQEAAGITTVCKLTHALPTGGYPDDVSLVDAPMMDGPRNDPAAFRRAVEAVVAALDARETVLVHCSRGSSRSPAVAAAALAVRRDCSVETALAEVQKSRAQADPHPALVRRAEDALDALG
ncbi:dual specificity protein phosphatase family protein [Halorussus salilacus]|uniref:dual specificity protein phosphatase family protein n=1 Tax=Halorussus salilacus TaxID=2953750 RepID=UPI00209CF764|nr:dual specificity protein phosphatase [Halorussus salilacus]USZ69084.1 dual specificity protein phosphatase family protein [Halorussus salilacus]